MKTKLCRPVLVCSSDKDNIYNILSTPRDKIMLCDDGAEYRRLIKLGLIPKRLVLISLNTDDRFNVGGYYYLDGGIYSSIPSCSGDPLTDAKKVIATQDQLSPDYIQQFVEEYNKRETKDVDVEMELFWNNQKYSKQLFPDEFATEKDRVYFPKLTPEGHITIVQRGQIDKTDTVIGKPLEDYIQEKHSQDRCMGFIDGYNVRKSEEPITYTEEEVTALLYRLADQIDDDYCRHTGNQLAIGWDCINNTNWFNKNKKN